jgi:VCBS repeat-containing protein
VTYSLSGGADQSKFSIVGGTGVLSFIAAPDFETPTDSGGDNTYVVDVTATDDGSGTLSDTQTITVTVTVSGVSDPPVINQGAGPLAFTVVEDSSTVSFLPYWDKSYGGSGSENVRDVIATNDGGYLLVGDSNSTADGDKSETSRGGKDYWAVKIDANGNKVWDKRFGGSSDDICNGVVATTDGGYLLAGYSQSGADGDKSEASRGSQDYWAVKIDANGTKVWDRRFGGSGQDICNDVVATTDGGYVLAGDSSSGADGDKSEASRGNSDYWAVKIDASGAKVWDKRFGGSSTDDCTGVLATSDGGYLLAGQSISLAGGDKSEARRDSYDYWAVKIDASGDKVWDKTFGGSSGDYTPVVAETADGGYLLAGLSSSGADGDKSEASRGQGDYWAVKIDASGAKVWDKTFGGSFGDSCNAVVATSDGGFVLAGQSGSGADGDKSEAGRGNYDYWAVKIDASGAKVWDKTFGGSSADECRSLVATSDGGYLLAGHSASGVDGEKSQASQGGNDFWVVKINADGNLTRPVDATDADGDNLTWSVLTPPSDGTATVSGTGAFPTTLTYLPDGNFSGNDSFVVQVSDGVLTDTITVNVTVTPVNDPPIITSEASTFTTAENNASASFGFSVFDADANTTLVYSKSGADAGLFTLNVATGQLNFTSAPDYEIPADADANNTYDVTVRATDTGGLYAEQSLSVTVTDVVEITTADVLSPEVWAEVNATAQAAAEAARQQIMDNPAAYGLVSLAELNATVNALILTRELQLDADRNATVNALILAREQQLEAERNATLAANPGPRFLTYSGRITVDGETYVGVGQFKFAFVNGDGSQTYWTHDGAATDGEPASGLSIDVSQGVYSIRLGDSAITGMAPLAPEVFQGRSDVRLRIWFARSGGSYELLSPDQPVSAVPYAFPAP